MRVVNEKVLFWVWVFAIGLVVPILICVGVWFALAPTTFVERAIAGFGVLIAEYTYWRMLYMYLRGLEHGWV